MFDLLNMSQLCIPSQQHAAIAYMARRRLSTPHCPCEHRDCTMPMTCMFINKMTKPNK